MILINSVKHVIYQLSRGTAQIVENQDVNELNKNQWLILYIGVILALVLTMGSSPVQAPNRCDSLISNCIGLCTTQGDCPSWFDPVHSGTQAGCNNGDPRIDTNEYHSNARAYLESLGYSQSWINNRYSDRDYTYSINGFCRYQAIVRIDNHKVDYIDGPEPNPQPFFCQNGNPALGFPWAWCVVDTVQEWHTEC
ncbi:MAG: hypothetical protein ACFFDI_23275 [Promethearchaeota archaeon]